MITKPNPRNIPYGKLQFSKSKWCYTQKSKNQNRHADFLNGWGQAPHPKTIDFITT